MADNSAIEWTDATWNPIRARNIKTGKVGWHCEHATTGCEFCYSEGFNKRLGTGLPFKPGHRGDIELFLDDEMLTLPLRWRRPRKIFVCSMTDLFADFVPDEWIDKMFAVMALTPHHTYQVLTKRAVRMRGYFEMIAAEQKSADDDPAIAPQRFNDIAAELTGSPCAPHIIEDTAWPLPNVWLGVSTERQAEADERIPLLLATPAAIRFISAEPLLGPIDLESAWHGENALNSECWGECGWCSLGFTPLHNCRDKESMFEGRSGIDWVIVGGESGPKARPMHKEWVLTLRAQCAQAGVPFFFKQWGEWAPGECSNKPPTKTERCASWFDDQWQFGTITPRVSAETHIDEEPDVYRFGKSVAGRMLDGELHNAMPERRR